MLFQFVPQPPGGGRPGRDDRRVIRSHVMRGRNAGRTRPAAQLAMLTPRALERYDCPACSEQTVGRRVHSCACHQRTLDMTRPIWNDLALVSLPCQLDARLSRLVHECFTVATDVLYPPKLCRHSDSSISDWLAFMHQDEAYLNGSLAIVSSYTDSFAGHAQTSPRALGYLSKAYSLLNQKLSGPEATSSQVIAAVTVIVVYHRIHNIQATGLVHFDGLERIIRLRGGIAALARENLDLAQKPMRLDIEFALQNGNRLRFIEEDAPSAGQPSPTPLYEGVITTTSSFDVPGIRSDLLAVAGDIEQFSQRLDGIRDDRMDQLQFTQQTHRLIHRLLHITPLNPCDQLDRLERVLYLGLLSLMVTLLHDYGSHHNRYDVLAAKMREALQSFVPVTAWEEVFALWVALVGGISVLRSCDDEWLLPYLEARCESLGLETWSQFAWKFGEFPWVHILHGEPGKRLFETARRTCGRPVMAESGNLEP